MSVSHLMSKTVTERDEIKNTDIIWEFVVCVLLIAQKKQCNPHLGALPRYWQHYNDIKTHSSIRVTFKMTLAQTAQQYEAITAVPKGPSACISFSQTSHLLL